MRAARSRRLLALAMAAALSVHAPPAAAAQDPQGWTVVWENDLFVPRRLSSDESYTNGVRIALNRDWERARRFGDAMRRHHPLARAGVFHSTTSALVLGQNFFTPGVITAFDPDPLDRPFAGLLYVGARVEITEDPPGDVRGFRILLQHALELDVGVMGPPALAGPTQAGVHVLVESGIPKGWDHQLGTEPALAVSAMSRMRAGWHVLDVVPHGGVMLGTPQTYGFAGLTARVGWNMTGFPALLIRQTAVPAADRPDWEVSLLAAVEGRAFARNAFVDGSLLGGPPSVPRKSDVGELQYGASLRLADWRGSYTFVRRSPEVRGDGPAGGRYHNFGSISLAYEPGMRIAADREGTFTGWLVDRVIEPVVRDLFADVGLGGGISRESGPAAEGSRGGVAMRAALGRRLGDRLTLAGEVAGVLREGPRPADPDEPHLDTFLLNRVVTARVRPFTAGPGPGTLHLRGGVGSARAVVESTVGPTRTVIREDTGWGLLLGAGYAIPVGESVSIGMDTAWSRLGVESADGPSARFVATTLAVHWHP